MDAHEILRPLPNTVGELMTRAPIRVSPGDPLDVAETTMRRAGVRHLPVVDDGHLAGILSLRDLLSAMLSPLRSDAGQRQRHLHALTVEQVMEGPLVTVTPATDVVTAAERMIANRFSCLPVVIGGDLVGILTSTDLVGLAVELLHREAAESESVRSVERLMSPTPVATAAPDDRLDLVKLVMRHEHFRHLPVLDGKGRLVGILSDHDVFGALRSRFETSPLAERLVDDASVTVAQVMTPNPESVVAESAAATAGKIMLRRHIGALPVLRAGRLVGILTETDFLSYVTAVSRATSAAETTP